MVSWAVYRVKARIRLFRFGMGNMYGVDQDSHMNAIGLG